MTDLSRPQSRPVQTQSAWIAMRLKDGSLRMGVRVTPAGILAVGALVSGILLSTAVIVALTKRRFD